MDFGERRFYGFPNVDNRGLKIADDVRGPGIDPSSGDRSPSPEGVAAARKFLARRFPPWGRRRCWNRASASTKTVPTAT
jgi:sarcosine oxidase